MVCIFISSNNLVSQHNRQYCVHVYKVDIKSTTVVASWIYLCIHHLDKLDSTSSFFQSSR